MHVTASTRVFCITGPSYHLQFSIWLKYNFHELSYLFSACLDGFYGVNCMNNCSKGCLKNTACDKTSGVCIEGINNNIQLLTYVEVDMECYRTVNVILIGAEQRSI